MRDPVNRYLSAESFSASTQPLIVPLLDFDLGTYSAGL